MALDFLMSTHRGTSILRMLDGFHSVRSSTDTTSKLPDICGEFNRFVAWFNELEFFSFTKVDFTKY